MPACQKVHELVKSLSVNPTINCRCGSEVEQRTRNAQVNSSNLFTGFIAQKIIDPSYRKAGFIMSGDLYVRQVLYVKPVLLS